jgi:hypothetical protein
MGVKESLPCPAAGNAQVRAQAAATRIADPNRLRTVISLLKAGIMLFLLLDDEEPPHGAD